MKVRLSLEDNKNKELYRISPMYDLDNEQDAIRAYNMMKEMFEQKSKLRASLPLEILVYREEQIFKTVPFDLSLVDSNKGISKSEQLLALIKTILPELME